jgi:ribosomal protein S18 acetylase RimI-like enzyme
VSGTAIEVTAVDAEGFRALVVTAAQIYGEAMARPPELVVQRREIMQSHVHRDGFAAVLARTGGEPVGFGYGYRGRAGEWWHDIVAKALGREASREWLVDAFELAELHLLPAHHGHGAGRAMLTALLAEAGGRTVVLSTHDKESPARLLYRSAGFVDLLTGFVFPGSAEVYAVMGRRQPSQP